MTNRFSSVQSNQNRQKASRAFTIVELLIVIVVIAILAAITVISYRGVTSQSKEAALKTELRNAADKIKLSKLNDSAGKYPASLSVAGVTQPKDVSYTYTGGGATFCLKAVNQSLPNKTFFITQEGTIGEGDCPDTTTIMQTITTSSCPTARTVVKDARDNHTYWIQKLADGNCWMLTNLAYAGGGTNTYGDTKTLQEGSSVTSTYTAAKYYNDTTKSNATSGSTNPSTSTDGGITGTQYGYLYNWCAAMGAQTSTSACTSASTPLPDTSVSICPAGWRLPTGGSNGEFIAFNTAVNGGLTTSSTELMSQWMAQYAGYWHSSYGFNFEGTQGKYWSSTQYSATAASYLHIESSYVNAVGSNYKYGGQSVRCIAN